MLSLLVAVVAAHGIFRCRHDAEMQSASRRMQAQRFTMDCSSGENSEFWRYNDVDAYSGPLRVHFDTQQISTDHHLGDGCTADDELTQAKVDIIKQTFESVRLYMLGMINVSQVQDGADMDQFWGRVGIPRPAVNDSVDLAVEVRPQCFGATSQTLATASPTRHSNIPRDLNRPIAGQINVNVARLPPAPENQDTGARQFFVTVIHELNHILSFSAGLFGLWINSSTGCPYSAQPWAFRNSYGIQQKFLSTPALVDWVGKRFAVGSNNIVGLEIEDGGGEGTAGSHPNARLYFTDVMQGITYGVGWLSPVFVLALEDSGWYKVNRDLMEPLIYMDVALHGTSIPNPNTLTQPAVLTFPPDYLIEGTTEACWYDLSAKGHGELAAPSIEGFNDDEAAWTDYSQSVNHTRWYNPLDREKIGREWTTDFAPIVMPNLGCRDHVTLDSDESLKQMKQMAKQMHEEFVDTPTEQASVCAMSTIYTTRYGDLLPYPMPACYRALCGSDGRLRFILDDGRFQLCQRAGKKLYSTKHIGSIRCPPEQEACKWHVKYAVVPIHDIIPDRGPKDGGNLILLRGVGLVEARSYTDHVWVRLYEIKGGKRVSVVFQVELMQVDLSDKLWLFRVPEGDYSKYVYRPFDLEFEVNQTRKPMSEYGRIFPEYYTFVNRKRSGEK